MSSADDAYTLVSLHAALTDRAYPLGAESTTIGRDSNTSDIVVTGPTISRQHCRFLISSGRVILEDLGSSNGTFVNHTQINGSVTLSDSDVIGLGGPQPDYLRLQLAGSDEASIRSVPAKDTWLIGRDPNADISLSFDPKVSSRHVIVHRAGNNVEVIDQGSLNGTWLKGKQIKRAEIGPSDGIVVGSSVLRLELQANGSLRVHHDEVSDQIGVDAVALTLNVRTAGLKGRTLTLLNNVSLAVSPGEFLGILGPSGAGKSTLLKALNGYSPPSYGCVLLNGTPLYRSLAMFRNSVGYVPQDDIVHKELSVRASIDYVARLRLPSDVTASQRAELVDSTIETLGLGHVADSRVGMLSGGQRKRVSIGCELITRPSLLFLDEPTSGMDPATEERLMLHFTQMAERGTTILITTHILYSLHLLDRIAVLSRGRLTFLGKPDEAMSFFSPDDEPLERATKIFDALEGESGGAARDPGDIAEEYKEAYQTSDHYPQNVTKPMSPFAATLLNASKTRSEATTSGGDGASHQRLLAKPAKKSWSPAAMLSSPLSPRVLWTLTMRNFAVKLYSAKQTLFYAVVPVILAIVTLFLSGQSLISDEELETKRSEIGDQLQVDAPLGRTIDIGPAMKVLLAPDGEDDPRSGQDVVFALKYEGISNLPIPISIALMFVMTAVFMGTLMSCLDLSTERPIYVRERMANQKIIEYLGSKLPFLFMLTALQCTIFLSVCMASEPMRDIDFGSALLALIMMAWTACTIGLFVSALDPTPGQFSVLMAIIVVLPQLVLSGGLAPDFYEGMSRYLKPVASALPARWGLEMLMTAFYDLPDRPAMAWTGDLVRDQIGFDFGRGVHLRNTAILAFQGLAWMGACGAVLRRLDPVR
jgi:ABC-type multidrug transport system ATPase subunit/pSer/pThr/pTyr-binding forkhead associated (FHA) protein